MSRYVSVDVQLSLSECEAALASLSLEPLRGRMGAQVMLEGSLECAGEPVDLRLSAGSLGAVEDFGFRRTANGALVLVCGDIDRRLLERELLAPLHAFTVRERLAAKAQAEGLTMHEELEADGTRRIVLRRD